MIATFGRAIAATLLLTCLSIPVQIHAQPWERIQAGTTSNLTGVFGADSYSLAVGANGTMIRFDGTSWSSVFTPTSVTLNAVWASAPSNVFAVGSGGTILRNDGSSTIRELSGTSANLHGVWGVGGVVMAVGDNGTVLVNDGSGWHRDASGTSRRLRAVAASDDVAVFAVGDHGTILRYDASKWTTQATPTTQNLHGVWVRSASDAFAVGSFGTILRYDGSTWRLQSTPSTLNLTAVWGFSDTHVFAVGDNGTILEFDGFDWRRVDNVTTLGLTAINNGFIVGDFGTVLRNPGTLLEVNNLRITEIDPRSGQVEITNEGPAFTSGQHPLCHRFDHDSVVPAGTSFAAGEIRLFSVSNLSRTDSDLWLYRTNDFDEANNLVHGVKYGPKSNVGQTSTAVDAGAWVSANAFVPAPPSGMSLAYDGFGSDPKDWYVNETPSLGSRDKTTMGGVYRELSYPLGTQDFERVELGDEAIAVEDWSIENSSSTRGIFTARVVTTEHGAVASREGSTRALRIRDQDGGDVRNVVASPVIETLGEDEYGWTFWISIEELTSSSGPVVAVEHSAGDRFVATWGVALHGGNLCLIVTDAGGEASHTCFANAVNTGGRWAQIEIDVLLTEGVVRAGVVDGPSALLPIDPAPEVESSLFRLAYIGSGRGNVATLLLDDVSVDVGPVVVPFGLNSTATLDNNAVTLAWKLYGDDLVATFDVYRRVDDGAEAHHAGPFDSVTRRFEDSGLAFGHEYTYVVSARRADGSEVRAAAKTVTIEPTPAAVFAELRAVAEDLRVQLAWSVEVVERIDGFRVYRRASNSVEDVDVTGGFLLPSSARHFADDDVQLGTYFYRVAAVKPDGREIDSPWSTVEIQVQPLRVSDVYPNPFSGSASVTLMLPQRSPVEISIYDVKGRRVTTLVSSALNAGENVATWNGRSDTGRRVSAGTYFMKVTSAGKTMTRKVVLVR